MTQRYLSHRCSQILALALVLVFSVGCGMMPSKVYTSDVYMDYGTALPASPPKAVSIEAVMDDPDAYLGREIALGGTVREVCQSKGCWMTMGSDEMNEAVMIKFTCPIDGRLIPMAAEGHHAMAYGVLERREVDEEYARHLAEDNGATAEELAAIVGPQEILWFGAPSARIYDLELQTP
ncbi:DUF4920 domain-containing protein [Mucisphaera sp.]|uniref:DUF4920 domain-containing protein n=1 Tax=Mucisphaera sp. TaxID=2913024 RepID=UPI003D146802